MSPITKIAFAATFGAFIGISGPASAEGGRLYPLTRCGPDLAYLCRLHGSFDSVPFHYNLAIYPGCIKTVAVQTPHGVQRQRAVVCGAPDRPSVWWW
ncbi:hypothetical protein JQ626_06695 [Bradyrhizobium diazoefficiens]|jgi:hypothetical protein|nr:hypothetical protein [Bradyrhizobium diazoefficiens]MBR0963766.1 hypothetical protein [Bradyrhizobium diazoefficiens]MBR1012731.1 hypothetical protein [Bradyrhizobium diazoefficiens]MBR1052279.1 hypothetical protein [Bradyrhizobium diazoefficiens]